MNDDPRQIANHLIEQFGVARALDEVRDGIAAAHKKRDNYRLSVWREVKRILEKEHTFATD
jgi:phytoene/squalene synthetase